MNMDLQINLYKIWFVFPEKDLGGVPTLIINLALKFNESQQSINLIISKGSYLQKKLNLIGASFNYIYFEDLKYKNDINSVSSNDVLVVFNWYLELKYFQYVNPRILFWNVFPDTFLRANIIPNLIRRYYDSKILVNKLFNILIKANGIVFMDGAPFFTNKYGLPLDNISYLPIPVVTYENEYLKKFSIEEKRNLPLRITYIGRGVDWKIFPFIKVLEDLNLYQDDFSKVALYVITENPDKYDQYVHKYVQNNNINIQYISEISEDNLHLFLLNSSDINISMGTSALESAKLGIPTILMDASYNKISDKYLYKWLFETYQYCLGTILNDDNIAHGFNLVVELKRLQSDVERIIEISDLCYNYVVKNHDINIITLDLHRYADKTTLRYNNIRNRMFIYTRMGIFIIRIVRFFKALRLKLAI